MHRIPSVALTLTLILALAGCTPNATHVAEHDATDAHAVQLEPGDAAVFSREVPFRQVGLLIDTDAEVLRGRLDGGVWRKFEITWSEGHHKVARLLLDEPATRLELRADAQWTFGTIEFHEQIVGVEVLARDLPLVERQSHSIAALAPADLVISRADWGARDPSKVCGEAHNPYRMAIHHTASPDSDGGDAAARMRQMQVFHIDTKGWCDIGYHFVISQAGNAYQGRSTEERTGAHVGGGNTGNIGVSFIGDYEANQVPQAQFDKASEMVGWVGRTYDIPFNRDSIKGHREHSGQSTNCPGVNLLNRLDELIAQASGQPVVPRNSIEAAFEVNLLGELEDFYPAGSSVGKPDFFPGDSVQAEIRLTNTSNDAFQNVILGYSFEAPHLSANNYTIQTDAALADQTTFEVNDANENPDNPPKQMMGTEGELGLYAFGAGETKRVLLELEVGSYSIGASDHPDVRGWVKHIDGLYGEQSAFGEDPTTDNAFDAVLQAFAEFDVLSRYEWQFDGGEPEQLEGWFGCAGVTPVVDPDRGTMELSVGAAGCVDAPAWTRIDGDRWDQIVIRLDAEEVHEAAVYWGREGEQLSEERAVGFQISPEVDTYVVAVGQNAGWSGEITRLRLSPSLEDAATVAVDAIFVQSEAGEVGSDRESFVAAKPVDMTDDVPPPVPDGEERPPAERPNLDEWRVKQGCSTSGRADFSGPWWGLGALVALRRRKR